MFIFHKCSLCQYSHYSDYCIVVLVIVAVGAIFLGNFYSNAPTIHLFTFIRCFRSKKNAAKGNLQSLRRVHKMREKSTGHGARGGADCHTLKDTWLFSFSFFMSVIHVTRICDKIFSLNQWFSSNHYTYYQLINHNHLLPFNLLLLF